MCQQCSLCMSQDIHKQLTSLMESLSHLNFTWCATIRDQKLVDWDVLQCTMHGRYKYNTYLHICIIYSIDRYLYLSHISIFFNLLSTTNIDPSNLPTSGHRRWISLGTPSGCWRYVASVHTNGARDVVNFQHVHQFP